MKPVAALISLCALVFAVPAMAEDDVPVPLDPAQPRGVQFLAMSNEVASQHKALEANYVSMRGRIRVEIERRREDLHLATDDEIERAEWGQLLDELQTASISELRTEFEVYFGQLNSLRRQATGELSTNGVLEGSTWSTINRFAARHPFDLPDVLVTAPEFDLTPMFEGFPGAIYNCSAFEETFAHPITSEPMKRHVFGVVGGRCHYEEEMPASGRMICHYSLERLTSLATYHSNYELYDRLEPVSSNEFIAGEAITTTSWTLDGRPYEHPVDAAMSAGECVVMGYDVQNAEGPAVAGLEE
ncbi:MAG: hypothetical protein QNI99_04920 [Woeseiaceae bacterium]|nr:hypothetical protein [Woeseiaceae bacterium]